MLFSFFLRLGELISLLIKLRLIEVLPKFAEEKKIDFEAEQWVHSSLRYANLNNFKVYNSTIQPSDLTRQKTTTLSVKIEPTFDVCFMSRFLILDPRNAYAKWETLQIPHLFQNIPCLNRVRLARCIGPRFASHGCVPDLESTT